MILNRSVVLMVSLLTGAILYLACGGGGGDEDVDLGALPLTRGGLKRLFSDDDAENGASVYVPPGAVDQDADLSITASDELPAGSPPGQVPVGKLFTLSPAGLTFDAGKAAVLTLPIPPGELHENLHIGRWSPSRGVWDKLDGEIDGDFIFAEIDHFSLFGIFYSGKSLVEFTNDMDTGDDPTGSGITLRYASGPVPLWTNEGDDPFPAYSPMAVAPSNLTIGESFFINLLPGQYKFEVSYPSPSPVTTVLTFAIPNLDQGADDGFTDQTISIATYGASSTDADTEDSIEFSGRVIVLGAEPPDIQCSANAPAGVTVASGDPSDLSLPSRHLLVGPIKREQLFAAAEGLELAASATDSENGDIEYCWTSVSGTLPVYEWGRSGDSVERRFTESRAGRYNWFLTAYDEDGNFSECQWTVIVEVNAVPSVDVIVDDRVVDFGRLGADEGTLGAMAMDRADIPAPPNGVNLCDYTLDTSGNGIADRTFLKQLEILPASEDPDHILRPTQYPGGMTCVFAVVGDADGDPLATRFKFPTEGDLYNALSGEKISTPAQLDAYNDLLTANSASFPVPPILAPLAPDGTVALPIIWEADDNANSSMPSTTSHDCRHVDEGPCLDRPGCFPAGGIINLVALTTDGFNREQIGSAPIGFGEDDIVRSDDVDPDPDPGPDPNESRYHVFKRSGAGYDIRYGGYENYKTGYDYFYWYGPMSEVESHIAAASRFEEWTASACVSGPSPYTPLPSYPAIWETGDVVLLGSYLTFEALDAYT